MTTTIRRQGRVLPLACIAALLLLSLPACKTTYRNEAAVFDYGLSGGADSAGVHTVASGDTVYELAERYQLSMQDLIRVNGLRPPYALDVGQRMKLPPPQTYNVRSGDTLVTIARTFNVSPNALAKQNKIAAPYRLYAGTTIRLPAPIPQVSPARQSKAVQLAGTMPRHKPQVKTEKGNSPTAQAVMQRAKITARTPARDSAKFAWPVDGPILSSYGPKKDGLHNDGINIGAPRNALVRAAENGVIVYADDQLEGFGNLVLIRHADRWMTAYAHMQEIKAKRGDTVSRGDVIGTVGSSGSADRPQLHFEVRRGTEALNPALYLAKQGS